MIKLIIFDMDGVLVNAKEIHYETLNNAIELIVGKKFTIDFSEHLSTYDGLKTTQKLDMLSEKKGLNKSEHQKIWDIKQKLTQKSIGEIGQNNEIISLVSWLKEEGYILACCSNSIRKTIFLALSRIGIIEYMDLILSNQDVQRGKPYPEIYWKAMSNLGYLPEETLIIEDSPTGLLAAHRSGANILRVDNPSQVRKSKIDEVISMINKTNNMKNPKWRNDKLNVLVPMAGAGTRFEKAGYTFPKPLIEVNGKPMIQVVVENLNIDANYIYVVQKSHRTKYNLDTLLNLITPNCRIVEVEGITEGAACTALLAKELIDNDEPLFFANSDQFAEWDSNEFMYKMTETNCDGAIVTFKATHPKWSFAKLDDNGFVTEVAEKNPISENATVGFYYWKRGSDFVKYAESMIDKDIRVNNEFYVCPVFNQAIDDGLKVRTFEISRMWGLGTPEDLNHYLNHHTE
jgi:HAD superfamily hydrolase (TIGR01509 family)